MIYSVKEACQKLEMTAHTVRHYTDSGLIPSVQRDENNNRLFNEQAIQELFAVRFLRQSGMSITEIKTFLVESQANPRTHNGRTVILQKMQERAHQQLDELTTQVKKIDDFVREFLQNDCK